MDAKLYNNLEQLKIHRNGITSDVSRVDAIPDPILFIGLGGTGVTALSKVKNAIYRRFNIPMSQENGFYKDKPDNIEFLAIDTFEKPVYDENEKHAIDLNMSTEFLRITQNNISRLLRDKTLLPPKISEWLDDHLTGYDLKQGAGGIRQLGRLALFLKIEDVIGVLEKKLKSVLEGRDGILYVFILTGISGGTGSGIFLDIPYLIRCIIDSYGAAEKLKIIGYIFLPDVNIANVGANDPIATYLQSNGFAALKELDFWMTPHDEPFEQDYNITYKHEQASQPYDYCYLISSIDQKGVPISNPYYACMEIVSENIVNFISKGKVQETTHTLQAYLSNIEQAKSGMFSGKPPFQANYEYFILGAAAYKIPVEHMMNYAAFVLMQQVKIIYENIPEGGDLSAFIEKLNLGHQDLLQYYFSNESEALPGWRENPAYQLHNAGKIDIDERLKNDYLKDNLNRFRNPQVMIDVRNEILQKIKSELELYFVAPEKGPIYVNRFLYSESDCLLRRLELLKNNALEDLDSIRHKYRRINDEASELLTKCKKRFMNLNRENQWNQYIEKKIAYYKLYLTEHIIREIVIPLYDALIIEINNLNSSVYSVWKEIIIELNKIFNSNGEIITNLSTKKEGNDELSFWSILEPKDWMQGVESILTEKSRESIMQVVTEFLEFLLRTSEYWISQGKDSVRLISGFVSNKFSEIAVKNFEEYLKDKYKKMTIQDIVTREIGPMLLKNATPIFQLDSALVAGIKDFPSHHTISIPEDCVSLIKSFEEYISSASTSGTKNQVAGSEIRHSIYWVNTRVGVPLYAYGRLPYIERIYEDRKSKPGIHLRREWIKLPSPFPSEVDDMRPDINKDNRELFREALELGMIIKDSDTMPCVKIKHLPEISADNVSEIMNKYIKLIPIFNSYDVQSAEVNFLKIPRYVEIVRTQIEAYKKAMKDKTEGKREKEFRKIFLTALCTGVLYWDRTKLLYRHSLTEEAWLPIVNKLDQHLDYYYHAFVSFKNREKRLIEILDLKSREIWDNDLSSEDQKQRLENLKAELTRNKIAIEEENDNEYKESIDFIIKAIKWVSSMIQII